MKLFREEALAAKSQTHLGTIRLASNLRLSIVAGIAMAIAVSLMLFALLADVPRKERLPGILLPASGTFTITSPATGVLLEKHIAEGEVVAKGQRLFIVGVDRVTNSGSSGEMISNLITGKLSALDEELRIRTRQAEEKTSELKSRIARLSAELNQANRQTALSVRKADSAQSRAVRISELQKQSFMSRMQEEQAAEESIDAQSRVEEIRRTSMSIERELESLQAQLREVGTQASIDSANLKRTQINISQERIENDTRRTIEITASKAGRISLIYQSQGSNINSGQPMVTLVPTGDNERDQQGKGNYLEAQLYATSKAIGFLQPGMVVWMRYAAFPHEKFGSAKGVVRAVSLTPVSATELPDGQGRNLARSVQTDEPLYRVDVQLADQAMQANGKELRLRPGMQLEADAILEERKIWEWILEPVLAVWSPRLATSNLGAHAQDKGVRL